MSGSNRFAYVEGPRRLQGVAVAMAVVFVTACGGGGGDSPPPPPPPPAPLAVLAGNVDGTGSVDGTLAQARFNKPNGLAMDAQGNLYVADTFNYNVRKVSAAGMVTTIAGTSGKLGVVDGTRTSARIGYAFGLAVDPGGNVYIADSYSCTVRKIALTGDVSTFAGKVFQCATADGVGTGATFDWAYGMAADSAGNLYVAETGSHTVRKITPAGVVTTLAGSPGVAGSADGKGALARFNQPVGITVDANGTVYVADSQNFKIRSITPDGTVTTLAGGGGGPGPVDGTGTAARFVNPKAIAVDATGTLVVGDVMLVRTVTQAGVVKTLAGSIAGHVDGTGAAARFYSVMGVAFDRSGNVLASDAYDSTLRKITPAGVVTTIGGNPGARGHADGTGTAALFDAPIGPAADAAGNLYVADANTRVVRKVTPAGGVSTLAGTPGVFAFKDGTGPAAAFANLSAIGADPAGNAYVVDSYAVRKISPAGAVTTIAGAYGAYGNTDGDVSVARFTRATGVVADAAGNLYIADSGNCTIRKITGNTVSTLAGTANQPGSVDGTGSAARFFFPKAITIDGNGTLYVIDGTNVIRKVTQAGVVTTVAGSPGMGEFADGTGTDARFSYPEAIATDAAGDVYIADTNNSVIRKMTPAGVVTTVVGEPNVGGFVEGPLPGRIAEPYGVVLVGKRLYFTNNNGIGRAILP